MTLIYTTPKPVWVVKADKKDQQEEEMLAAILAYLDAVEPDLTQKLRRLWSQQRDLISLADMEGQIRRGTLIADWYGDWHESYREFIDKVMTDMYLDAMRDSARNQLSRHPAFTFDTTSQGVLDWINGRQLALSDMLTRTQVNAMSNVITLASQSVYAVEELAQLLHDMIGLTPRQASAIERYYDTLREEGMSAEQALRRAQKYIKKSLNRRALNIARNELVDAFNEGSTLAVKQAQQMGIVGDVMKTWVTQHDESVCPLCAPMDGVSVPMDETFPNGLYQPGGHIGCRCVLVYKEVKRSA